MKKSNMASLPRAYAAWLIIAAAPIAGAQAPSPPSNPPTPAAAPAALSAEQSSYLFGLTFGEQMHRVGISDQVNLDAVTRGMRDGLHGKKSTPADQQQLNAYVRSVMEAAVVSNQTAARDFLARNTHEKGVTTTASGLQYKIISPGDNKAAAITSTDEVTVQYAGKLLDGTEFDSSYKRGTPAVFTVNGVIRGWQEALVLMKPGAKWQLFVPPELGYGTIPKGGIPGGSLLIFEVEVVSVKAKDAAAATPKPLPAPRPVPKKLQ